MAGSPADQCRLHDLTDDERFVRTGLTIGQLDQMLKAIRKTRIYEEVVSQVHDLIKEGKLKAGDQLPSER